MSDPTSRVRARRKPIAAGVAGIFALAAPIACIATSVTDCTDGGGPNTLRSLVVSAANNSTIDTSACSTITLTAGAIPASQTNLTINGPTAHTTVRMSAGVKERVFTHTGTGNFTLNRLDVQYGNAYDGSLSNPGPGVNGGCIASAGNVILTDASVTKCNANSLHGRVYGGGIYASKAIWATRSTIADNIATSITATTYGGGAFCTGEFIAKYSTIDNNVSCTNAGCGGIGGGVASHGGASIANSTISGNVARSKFGGVSLTSISASPPSTTISNSTISGNRAITGSVGGLYTNSPLIVRNSTIAFNTAGAGSFAAGLAVNANYSSITVDLESALLSNNTYGSTPTASDFSTAITGPYTLVVNGADNLIFASASGAMLPSGGGLVTACPLLGPLRGNGGSTRTHQLFSHSPAIDVGNDTSAATGTHYDQRGTGFLRGSGIAPDIGAYELQQGADIVFNAGFDGCP